MASAKRPVLLDASRSRPRGLDPNGPKQASIAAESIWHSQTASIAVLDSHGTIIEVNEGWRRVADCNGLADESYCVGWNYLEVCQAASSESADAATIVRGLKEILSGERAGFYLEYSSGPDANRWFIIRASRFEQDGSFRVAVAHEEITSIRLARPGPAESERSLLPLSESKLILPVIYESVNEGLFILRVEAGHSYRFISVNEAFLRLTGFTRQQIVGKRFAAALGVQAAGRATIRFGRAILDNKPEQWEEALRFPAGERICEVVVTPILDESEDGPYIFGTVHDVTSARQAQIELLESWELNRSLLFSLNNRIAVLDRHGTIISANQSWTEHRKRGPDASPEGISEGVNYLEVCEKAAGLGAAGSREALDGIRSVIDGRREYFEMEYLSSDTKGGVNWLKMAVTPLRRNGGAVVSHLDITEQKLAEQRVRDLSGRLIHGQEEERRRIARELHDDVNQRLALLAIELEQFAREEPEMADQLQRRAQDLCRLVQSISTDVHRLSHKLHPSKLDHLGLIDAARDFCTEISQHHGIHVDFFHRDVPDRIPGEISLCVFRIIQESLQNVVKHSGAKQAYVGLVGQSGEIHLEVSDPGTGFDPESEARAGLGLVSMRERVRFAGGEMWIRSRLSQGTRIDVKMPLRAPAFKKAPMAILIDN